MILNEAQVVAAMMLKMGVSQFDIGQDELARMPPYEVVVITDQATFSSRIILRDRFTKQRYGADPTPPRSQATRSRYARDPDVVDVEVLAEDQVAVGYTEPKEIEG